VEVGAANRPWQRRGRETTSARSAASHRAMYVVEEGTAARNYGTRATAAGMGVLINMDGAACVGH